jgi:hypothetical protein
MHGSLLVRVRSFGRTCGGIDEPERKELKSGLYVFVVTFSTRLKQSELNNGIKD